MLMGVLAPVGSRYYIFREVSHATEVGDTTEPWYNVSMVHISLWIKLLMSAW